MFWFLNMVMEKSQLVTPMNMRTPHPCFTKKKLRTLLGVILAVFLTLPDAQVSERWLGKYVSRPSGEPWIYKPIDGVMLVNRIGGVGMTTSFGLAQEVFPEC